MLNDEADNVAAPVPPLDVSAFTGDDGMVHFIIQCGDRVTEVSGKATAVLEELIDNPVQVFSALGFDTFRRPKSRLQFTLQIEDATVLTRGVPVRVANLEEDGA